MAKTPGPSVPEQPAARAKKCGSMRALIVILVVLGIAALAVGFVYLSVASGKLPSFLGKIPGGTTHRFKRGYAGIVAGAVLLLIAFLVGLPRKQQHA
jgi:hypothetical protein